MVAVVGVLIAADSIKANGRDDYITADKRWLFVTVLTVGYMLSRGIARPGCHEPYTEDCA